MMPSGNTREIIIEQLTALQNKGFSYQDLCDFINSQDAGLNLYKDFFSRLRSQVTYYKGPSKREKLAKIQQYVSRFYHQHIDAKDLMRQDLIRLIRQALELEFESYASVNQSTTDYLDQLANCYDRSKPAFLNIENNLKHKIQYGWVLDIQNHGSNFKLLSIEVSSLFSSNAVIKTNEYWKICWVNQKSKTIQYDYDAINQQTYLLSKNEDQTWTITENMYQSAKSRIRPELVNKKHLKKLSSLDATNLHEHATHFLANNDLLHLIELILTEQNNSLTEEELESLQQLKEQYIDIHRLLNTDIINLTTFQLDLKDIKAELQPMIVASRWQSNS